MIIEIWYAPKGKLRTLTLTVKSDSAIIAIMAIDGFLTFTADAYIWKVRP